MHVFLSKCCVGSQSARFLGLIQKLELCVRLKVVPAIFLQVCFLSLNESTAQTRKNVFYFVSEALFFLEENKF